MYLYSTFTHNRKMKKIVKKSLIVFVVAIFFTTAFCFTFLAAKYLKYKSLPLNIDAINNSTLSVEIFSKDNTPIEDSNQFNGSCVKLDELSDHTKQAFISIEDKDFYKHDGINRKRIVKAALNNLKSFSFKEGASTITQQLVKNTHLSSEKTVDRKIKEIALAKKLEKSLDKNKILESYLNIIFFGNNCYGLEDASRYYFNKGAKDLTLEESCTLAGMIKSPNRYSPINNPDLCTKRRNLVLSEMEKDGFITVDEKITAQSKPVELNLCPKPTQKLNTYSQASLDEASKILNLPAKQIALSGFKIHTYFDEEKQNVLTNALSDEKLEQIDNAAIVVDNNSHGISAYYANSNYKFYDIKRQPASTLKPLLVYAPALNENVISPSTQINDEKIKIGSYEPENVNKKFLGFVSVTDAVKNSINIPAIKVLSYITIETGKSYAEKMKIEFDEKDDSYALALGGMTYGTTLSKLASAYSTFANRGMFSPASFVQYITDKNDQLVYMHHPQESLVFREDSAFLMTNILQESAKSGTAKRLAEITNTEIASKTGTVGNSKGNTDAYNISFTPEETIAVWFGSLENKPSKITGGNQATNVVKKYVENQNYQKTEFDIPSSIVNLKIDSLEKDENHRILLASSFTPNRYTEEALFSRFNAPEEVSQNFIEDPKINADCYTKNGQIVLSLSPQKHIEYQIFKNEIPYQKISDKNQPILLKLPFSENEAKIRIIARYQGDGFSSFQSEKEFLLSQTEIKQKNNEKWYI